MKISRIALTTMALALMLVAFAAGRLTTLAQVSRAVGAPSPTSIVPQPTSELAPELAPAEVEGEDVPDIPRYPGSTRVEFRRTVHADVTVTEAEYVADDEIDAIRDFFRDFLHTNAWTMTDIDFSAGEWTIVAVAGEREVVLEIESRRTLAEYEVKITEPNAGAPDDVGTTATVDEPPAPDVAATPEPADADVIPTLAPTQPAPTMQPAPPVQPTATAQPPANLPAPVSPNPPPANPPAPVSPNPPADDDSGDDQDDGDDGADDRDDGNDG